MADRHRPLTRSADSYGVHKRQQLMKVRAVLRQGWSTRVQWRQALATKSSGRTGPYDWIGSTELACQWWSRPGGRNAAALRTEDAGECIWYPADQKVQERVRGDRAIVRPHQFGEAEAPNGVVHLAKTDSQATRKWHQWLVRPERKLQRDRGVAGSKRWLFTGHAAAVFQIS